MFIKTPVDEYRQFLDIIISIYFLGSPFQLICWYYQKLMLMLHHNVQKYLHGNMFED